MEEFIENETNNVHLYTFLKFYQFIGDKKNTLDDENRQLIHNTIVNSMKEIGWNFVNELPFSSGNSVSGFIFKKENAKNKQELSTY